MFLLSGRIHETGTSAYSFFFRRSTSGKRILLKELQRKQRMTLSGISDIIKGMNSFINLEKAGAEKMKTVTIDFNIDDNRGLLRCRKNKKASAWTYERVSYTG